MSGGSVEFEVSSVGATGNAVMAAVGAVGDTTISNAAMEPEITCLCDFLSDMGARISGVGTSELRIEGSSAMKCADVDVIPDRIEAATFLIAGAMSGERITVDSVVPEHLSSVVELLRETGNEIEVGDSHVTIAKKGRPAAVSMTTAIYPGFPTDVQAQWMALMSMAEGDSSITDTVYLDRFTHIAELNRLGADITLHQNVAEVRGREQLKGAHVMSTDIRASASLILAGLAAEGRTEISRVYHIDRGYERIEEKFQSLGGKIERARE